MKTNLLRLTNILNIDKIQIFSFRIKMSSFKSEIIFENTVNSNDVNDAKTFRILHFNDVYNIEANNQEPVGGAARFINVLESLISQKPTLVFFSGDALSPSESAE